MKMSARFRSTLFLCLILACVSMGANAANFWTQLPSPSLGGPVQAVASQPGVDGTYLIATPVGIFRETAADAQWQNVLEVIQPAAVAFAPSDNQIAYAVAGGFGIYKSSDGGSTWQIENNGVQNLDGLMSLAIDPSNPEVVYVVDVDSILKTTNGGSSWSQVNNIALPGVINAISVDQAIPMTVFAAVSDPTGGG
ncbi:MAG: hypothetical protein KGK44_06935, partial [Gammaproteobacteria bacterium]|nr:hypothetical protein [Gammaproteobacteria bacterium]